MGTADLATPQENLDRPDLLCGLRQDLRQDLRGECAAMFVRTMEDWQTPAFARQLAAQYAGESSDNPPDTFWSSSMLLRTQTDISLSKNGGLPLGRAILRPAFPRKEVFRDGRAYDVEPRRS